MLLMMQPGDTGTTVDPPSSSTAGYFALVWAFISLALTVVSYGG